jgi:hypothetical protein
MESGVGNENIDNKNPLLVQSAEAKVKKLGSNCLHFSG